MANTSQEDELVNRARDAMPNACCRFSQFPVAAAIRTARGDVFVGVNVESSSYGATICAERSALVAALSAGEREFAAIAIVTNAATPTMPCGICRQLLHDYAPDIRVIAQSGDSREERLLVDLLPDAFDSESLRRTH